MTRYDMTVQVHGKREVLDIVASGETMEEAKEAARKIGRIIRVHGIAGTAIAFDGGLSWGDPLNL